MDSTEGYKGRIVLFGKTGEGKSTVANVLVTGSIENAAFEIGHGVVGCTSRIKTMSGNGWTVADTVGLGEGMGGTVPNEDAEQIIVKFLKEVRAKYSHIIYVKSSTNRFDTMDENIWKVFKRVFKGAENAFTILFTKGDPEWLDENWDALPDWVHDCGRGNVLITNIPPVSNRPVKEKKNEEIRRVAYTKLEQDLIGSLNARGGGWETPDICKMNDKKLHEEGRSILKFIRTILCPVVELVNAGLGIAASMVTIFTSN